MGLRFGGARANRRPAEEIAKVLRTIWIERFGGERQPHLNQVHQQLARDMQTGFHIKGVVHVGIVDQPFPADGGAGFFEIDAHNDIELILQLVREIFQATSVIQSGFSVMDRTGTANHQQTRIAAGDDVGNGLPRSGDLRFLLGSQRKLRFQLFRRN